MKGNSVFLSLAGLYGLKYMVVSGKVPLLERLVTVGYGAEGGKEPAAAGGVNDVDISGKVQYLFPGKSVKSKWCISYPQHGRS